MIQAAAIAATAVINVKTPIIKLFSVFRQ